MGRFRKLIARLLLKSGHLGKLYKVADLAALLRIGVDVSDNDDVVIDIDESLLVPMLRDDLRGDDYVLSYREDLGIKSDGFLFVSLPTQVGSARQGRTMKPAVIGRFPLSTDGKNACIVPLHWAVGLERDVKAALVKHLEDKSKSKMRSRKRKVSMDPDPVESNQRRLLTAIATKPTPDSKLGLILKGVRGPAGNTFIIIDSINPDCLFAGTELRRGMKVESINGNSYSNDVAECMNFLKTAVGKVTIVFSDVNASSNGQSNDTVIDVSEGALAARLDEQLKEIEEQRRKLESALSVAAKTQLSLRSLRTDETNEEDDTLDLSPHLCNDNASASDKLYYTLKGRAGSVPCRSVVLRGEIESDSNLVPLHYTDNDETRRKREGMVLVPDSYGAVQTWVTSESSIVGKNYLSRLIKHNEMIKKLKRLFSPKRKRCILSMESMQMITACLMHNNGGSDEGGVMALAAAFWVIHHEIKLDVTPEGIAHGTPSAALLAESEKRLAAMCRLLHCYRMKKRSVKHLHVATDHGNKDGMDGLIKGFSYGWIDSDNVKRIVFFIWDIDACGHQSLQVVAGIERAVNDIKKLVPGVQLDTYEGDNGGGGGCTPVEPLLLEKGVLSLHGRTINCFMHGMSKMIETPCRVVIGKPGIGQRNCLQLGYAAITVYRGIIDEGGTDLLNEVFGEVVQHLLEDAKWQTEAANNCKPAFLDVMKRLDNEDTDAAVQETIAPKNIQLPLDSRWGSMLAMAEFVTENWTVIYFLCVAVKQSKKASLSLAKIACNVLSLMKTKAAPVAAAVVDRDAAERAATASTVATASTSTTSDENNDTDDSDDNSNPGSCPVYYAQLHFMRAFGECFFKDWFNAIMGCDHRFGSDSFGYKSRNAVAFVLAMRKELDDLMDEESALSWKRRPEFSAYRKSYQQMPDRGDVKNGGKEFFEYMPKVFFEYVNAQFVKHVENCWLSLKIFPYILWSDYPELARQTLNWLATAEDGGEYEFESEEVCLETLPSGRVPAFDAKVALTNATANLKASDLLEHKLIKDNKVLLWQMGSSEALVEVWEPSTWPDGEDYTQLQVVGVREIQPHLTQNQKIENSVYMMGQVVKTGVGQVRRTNRAINESTFKRPFNLKSLEEKRSKEGDPEKRAKIKRVVGSERTCKFIGNTLEEMTDMKEAVVEYGEEYKRLVEELGSCECKVSADELKEILDRYKKGIAMERRVTAAEEESQPMAVTAAMGSKVTISTLHKNKGHDVHVYAEIEERGIEPPQALDKMAWSDVKNLLKNHEYKALIDDGSAQSIENWREIKEITPLSEKLKELLKPTE